MKIIFQAIVPPCLLIGGLVLMKQLSPSKASKIESIQLSPSLYLQQGLYPVKTNTEVIWKLRDASSK